MAKLRNVSDSDLYLAPVGRAVVMDEVVEVPDDVFQAHAWPESLWAVVAPGRKNKDGE